MFYNFSSKTHCPQIYLRPAEDTNLYKDSFSLRKWAAATPSFSFKSVGLRRPVSSRSHFVFIHSKNSAFYDFSKFYDQLSTGSWDVLLTDTGTHTDTVSVFFLLLVGGDHWRNVAGISTGSNAGGTGWVPWISTGKPPHTWLFLILMTFIKTCFVLFCPDCL